MRQRPLGQSGIQASVIGLGTWAIGGWMWGGADEQNSIDAIKTAIDEGINLIDTAPAYGLGHSEEIVGKAIEGKRDQVIIATKCGLQWHTDKGTHFFDEFGKSVYRYLGADSIRYEVEQSLKRLNTDYIDLYQTHWQDATTPIEETMTTLLDLKKEGKIRAIGVSNINVMQLEEYRKYGPVDSAQEKYSMLDRKLEKEIMPYCKQNNIAILAYSPLELGLLSGKITPETEFHGDDLRKNNPKFSQENIQKVNTMLQKFQPIADRHGLTISQLIIAWTTEQPGMTHVLVGSRKPQHAKENAKAGTVQLSENDVKEMNDIAQQFTAEM